MARILALDYGKKRTGIAVTDELQLIASGLTTIATRELLPYLEAYCHREKVERIVIGEPKRMSSEPSGIEEDIVKFCEDLKKAIDLPLTRVDERFTSKMASRSLLESGLKKKKRRDKALLDEVSATIILQTYLYKS